MRISAWTTASAPSQVVGMPGYWNRGSAPRLGWAVRTGVSATAVLIVVLDSGLAEQGLSISRGGGGPGGTQATDAGRRRGPGTCTAGSPTPAGWGTSAAP